MTLSRTISTTSRASSRRSGCSRSSFKYAPKDTTLSHIILHPCCIPRLRDLGAACWLLDTQIDHLEKNIPAMHRACLFWIWQMSENAGLQYTDKVANAHSILVQKVEQELLPHMTDAERRANSSYK